MPESDQSNLWARARSAAAETPESRNRYVDFLRALSILAVISGHWLVAAPFVGTAGLQFSNILEYQPWTRWLTWLFQVMPIFFLVGGYSNGVSWKSALRDGRSYSSWLTTRLQRLVAPVLPLLVVWILIGVAAHQMGIPRHLIQAGSKMALIPIWFLAVYVMVVVVVPVTYSAWQRFGLRSFWLLVILAAMDDALFFAADLRGVGWLNYAFIWLAVHQLGYAWGEGLLSGPKRAWPWAAGGMILLVGLVTIGPHPLSMVSVPGEEVSNSLPPKLPMLALGLCQCGLFLSLETPMRGWLQRAVPWSATVLVNGLIMTIFLWHLTASTLTTGLVLVWQEELLGLIPGTDVWWLTRPVWILAYVAALTPLVLMFGRFERNGNGTSTASWRLIAGAVLVCGGLALIALNGVAVEGLLSLGSWVLLLPFVGALIAGVIPTGKGVGRDKSNLSS